MPQPSLSGSLFLLSQELRATVTCTAEIRSLAKRRGQPIGAGADGIKLPPVCGVQCVLLCGERAAVIRKTGLPESVLALLTQQSGVLQHFVLHRQ